MSDDDLYEEQPLWEVKKDFGNTAFKAGQFEEAIKYYTEAVDENPTAPMLYSNRSAAYLKRGKYVEAMKDAETAIAHDPTFIKAYPRLHNALCNQGKFSDASRTMIKGLEVLRASAAIEDLANLEMLQRQALQMQKAIEDAKQFLSEGKHSGAEKALLDPARAFPDCPTIMFMFAEARAAREPDEVFRNLSAFSRTHENDPHYLFVRALANYYRGGQDTSKNTIALLRGVLEMDPDYNSAGVLLKKVRSIEAARESGNTCFKARNFKEACDHYTNAIDLDGSNKRMNSILRGNRAAARLELKDFAGSLMDCDFAIVNGNESAKMYARRSKIYEAMEKMDEAMRDMEKATETDGDNYARELQQLKARVKRAKRKDYYKILGVDHTADEAAIKRAYKKSALIWHPDKWANESDAEKATAEAKFKEVGEALSVLSDPKKKHMYDNGQLDNDVEGGSGGGGGGMGNEDMMRMFNMMFQGGGGGGDPFGGGGGGGRRGGRQGGAPPGFSFSYQ